jgi:glycosyltransferase involved in cell wall biosynthesis
MRLLEYFTNYLHTRKQLDGYFFIFDARLRSGVIDLVGPKRSVVLPAGEKSRKDFYHRLPASCESIFCFGSVPPPVDIKHIPVTILQHNPFFFESPGYKLPVKVLYLAKRYYIRWKTRSYYHWIVQTPRMKQILLNVLNAPEKQVAVKPFFELGIFKGTGRETQQLVFAYPADGVPQKNHFFLLRAWEQLFTHHNINYELHLTIPQKYKDLVMAIERLQRMGVRVINHGFVSREQVRDIYSKSGYLIFPSLSESFGLPLVEAASCGLSVIGSNLPFLFQVVQPSATFDPRNTAELIGVIKKLNSGETLPQTKVLVQDNLDDVVARIQPNDKTHD